MARRQDASNWKKSSLQLVRPWWLGSSDDEWKPDVSVNARRLLSKIAAGTESSLALLWGFLLLHRIWAVLLPPCLMFCPLDIGLTCSPSFVSRLPCTVPTLFWLVDACFLLCGLYRLVKLLNKVTVRLPASQILHFFFQLRAASCCPVDT